MCKLSFQKLYIHIHVSNVFAVDFGAPQTDVLLEVGDPHPLSKNVGSQCSKVEFQSIWNFEWTVYISMCSEMPVRICGMPTWFNSWTLQWWGMVYTCRTREIIVGLHISNVPNKYYCTSNIYPIYQWSRNRRFAHVKKVKKKIIALWEYTISNNGSETVGSHMSITPNKMLLHFEYIPYIPMV